MRHRPALLDTPAAMPVPLDSDELWRILDGCERIDGGGVLLSPEDVDRLVDVAVERFGPDRSKTYRTLAGYLVVFIVGGHWRVLWDTQRSPLIR